MGKGYRIQERKTLNLWTKFEGKLKVKRLKTKIDNCPCFLKSPFLE
jgi:hypothetical protein